MALAWKTSPTYDTKFKICAVSIYLYKTGKKIFLYNYHWRISLTVTGLRRRSVTVTVEEFGCRRFRKVRVSVNKSAQGHMSNF